MKTKRLDFDYKPLSMNRSMSIVGTVTDRQTYDPGAGLYIPDYTVSFLSLKALITVHDPDNIIADGDAAASLGDIAWYVTEDGTRTPIEDSNTDYVVTRSGANAGQLVIKRNVLPDKPLMFEFHATYVDPRSKVIHSDSTITGEIYKIIMTHTVRCETIASNPELTLDCVDHQIWNPLRDNDSITIAASLKIGNTDVPTANRIFVWQKFEGTGSNAAWRDIDLTNEIMDYDVSYPTGVTDGSQLTINRNYMGHGLQLRCWVKYDPYGSPSSKTYNVGVPQKIITIDRRIPNIDYDIYGVPTNVTPGLTAVKPECRVHDARGEVTTKAKEIFSANWYIKDNSKTTNYALAATGYNPSIPTTAISNTLGGMIGLELQDNGVQSALLDSTGAVLVDGDGKVLLARAK